MKGINKIVYLNDFFTITSNDYILFFMYSDAEFRIKKNIKFLIKDCIIYKYNKKL